MLKKYSWVALLSGVLSIIAGLYILAYPAASLASFAVFFTLIFLVQGISEIIQYFSDEKKNGWNLANGILTTILAFAILSSSFLEKVALIPYLIAFWALFNGITKIFVGLELKKVEKKVGNGLIWMGVFGILAGLIMMGHPIMTALVVTYGIGFIFIYQGIVAIFHYFKIKKAK